MKRITIDLIFSFFSSPQVRKNRQTDRHKPKVAAKRSLPTKSFESQGEKLFIYCKI
jgi:hypothetical protein